MKYTRLGNTGTEVSRICLGCMSFGDSSQGITGKGWAIDEQSSREIIKRALDLGINYFDTANVYSAGTSEEFVGRALKDTANRSEIVLATKVHFPMGEGRNCRGLSRKEIMYEVDQSLKRLGMDYKDKEFFNFTGFAAPKSHDTDPNLFMRFLKNLGRNVKGTGLYFLVGIALSALFQRYVPGEAMTNLFGGNEAFGVLMAATIGVPLYACGGGTIPLLQAWLSDGMSMGSAAAFMLTGPSTKITNMGAVKIVLGVKRFALYIAFVMAFSLVAGLAANLVI